MKRILTARDIERLENTSFASAFQAPAHHASDTASVSNLILSGDQCESMGQVCVSHDGVCTNVGLCSNDANCIQISRHGCTYETCGCTVTETTVSCHLTGTDQSPVYLVGPAALLDLVRRQ